MKNVPNYLGTSGWEQLAVNVVIPGTIDKTLHLDACIRDVWTLLSAKDGEQVGKQPPTTY